MERGATFYSGLAVFALIIGLIVTVIGSQFVLWRYRKAVLRAMRQTGGADSVTRRSYPSRVPWTGTTGGQLGASVAASVSNHARRLAIVYTLAALIFAWSTALIIGFFEDLSIVRIVVLAAIFVWPLYPTLLTIVPRHFVLKWVLPVAYFGALYIGIASRANAALNILMTVVPIFILLPAVIALLIFRRRVRSIGPLIFSVSFVVVYLGGIILWHIGQAFIGGLGLFFAAMILIAGAALVYFSSTRLARKIAVLYARKKFSGQMLTIYGWWLSFSVMLTIIWLSASGFKGLTLIIPWVAFVLTTRLGFVIVGTRRKKRVTGLLLLRVFKANRQARALYGSLERYWQNVGPINMIAGADLATDNFEPDEVLNYLAGHLDDRFLRIEPDVDKRMATLDEKPDPDGRFRTNEVFCNEDIWRSAFIALAERADLVMFDLRGFSSENIGARFELSHVLTTIPLGRLVLLVDSTTDIDNLRAECEGLLVALPSDSPNAGLTSSKIQFVDSRKKMKEIVMNFEQTVKGSIVDTGAGD